MKLMCIAEFHYKMTSVQYGEHGIYLFIYMDTHIHTQKKKKSFNLPTGNNGWKCIFNCSMLLKFSLILVHYLMCINCTAHFRDVHKN